MLHYIQNTKNINQIHKEFIKFCVVGLSGLLINISITYFCTEYLGIWYIVSNIIAQIIAITNNFIWNKFKTFKNKNIHKIHIQYTYSILTYIFSGLISIILLYIFTDKIGIWYIHSVLIVAFIGLFINFSIHKFFVFIDKP